MIWRQAWFGGVRSFLAACVNTPSVGLLDAFSRDARISRSNTSEVLGWLLLVCELTDWADKGNALTHQYFCSTSSASSFISGESLLYSLYQSIRCFAYSSRERILKARAFFQRKPQRMQFIFPTLRGLRRCRLMAVRLKVTDTHVLRMLFTPIFQNL